jgi:hypothetical protein
VEVKLIRSPLRRPLAIGVLVLPDESVPVKVWNRCSSVRSPSASRHVPPTLAGTKNRCAVHQLPQSPSALSVWSGAQPVMPNPLMTMREPGLSSRNFGISLSRFSVSRNIAMTFALEMSAAYMSP